MLFEGILLSVIGIPIGIAVGLLIELLGTAVVTGLLCSLANGGILHVDSLDSLKVNFVVSPLMFLGTVVVSFGTVLLSAWLPARKAAKVPAIDAIRGKDEVQLNVKSLRTSALTQKLFGFEGALASKSLKRSRRNFRATIVSLTISIVLLVAAGSFGAQLMSSVNATNGYVDAAALASWTSDVVTDGAGNNEYLSLDSMTAETISGKLSGYGDNTQIYGTGDNSNYTVVLPDVSVTDAALITVDENHYEQLCQTARVPVGSNLLINLRRENNGGAKKVYAPYDYSTFDGQTLTFTQPGHDTASVTINGELAGADVANEILFVAQAGMAVIVPYCDSTEYAWFANTDDVAGFSAYAGQVLNDLAPQSTGQIKTTADCIDIAGAMSQAKLTANTIMYFVYG